MPDLKKECIWLKEINAQSLQVSLLNLDNAFIKFYKGQADFPKFKKKSNRQSFNIPQDVRIKNNKLLIPKFREGIDIILHRVFKGIIRQTTIIKTSTGKYFASILVENNVAIPVKVNIESNSTIGVDLGLKSFLITSNSEKFDNPKYLKNALLKLSYIQSKYSKHKGHKTKHKLALLHEKVANQRKDFLQKLSSELISENQTICLEDLNIKGMIQNHCLAKSISDVGWGMFVEMLRYKAEWQGKNIIQIEQFEPSSKTCHVCGHINKELTLKDREWTCNNCNTTNDRDINAAINIKNFALKNKLCVGRTLENHEELPTLVGALTYEA